MMHLRSEIYILNRKTVNLMLKSFSVVETDLSANAANNQISKLLLDCLMCSAAHKYAVHDGFGHQLID